MFAPNQGCRAFVFLIAGLFLPISPGCVCSPASKQPQSEYREPSDVPAAHPEPITAQGAESRAPQGDSTSSPPKFPANPVAERPHGERSQGGPSAGIDDSGSAADETSGLTSEVDRAGTPGEARIRARELIGAARRSAAAGDYGHAFQEARQGWEEAARYPKDAECKELAESLLGQMRTFGAKANAESRPSRDKTLVLE